MYRPGLLFTDIVNLFGYEEKNKQISECVYERKTFSVYLLMLVFVLGGVWLAQTSNSKKVPQRLIPHSAIVEMQPHQLLEEQIIRD